MFYLFVCKLDMMCIHDVHGYSDETFNFYFRSSHNRKEKLGRGTNLSLPLFLKRVQMNFISAENAPILYIKSIDNMKITIWV